MPKKSFCVVISLVRNADLFHTCDLHSYFEPAPTQLKIEND